MEKTKEFAVVLLGSAIVSSLFLIADNENYARAIQVGTFILAFYFIYNYEGENSDTNDGMVRKFGSVVGILLLATFGSVIMTTVILGISGYDPCRGWGESGMHCAIEEVGERYNIVDYREAEYGLW